MKSNQTQNTLKNDSKENLPHSKYVRYSLYLKLKEKLNKKVEENTKLKKIMNDIIEEFNAFKQICNVNENLYSTVAETISQMKSSPPKPKEEFSTKSTTDLNKQSGRSLSNNLISNVNQNFQLIKKIDEMESFINEMTLGFNNMVLKYKILKNDYENMERELSDMTTKYELSNKEATNLMAINEVNSTKLAKTTEIEKCLLETTMNVFLLNTNHHRKSITKESIEVNPTSINKQPPYILCEPIPSFVKFIQKVSE